MGRAITPTNMIRRETGFNTTALPDATIGKMKLLEAPEFRHGKLIKLRPLRHTIPRCKFYYDSEEWFNATELPKNRERTSVIEQMNHSAKRHEEYAKQRKRSKVTQQQFLNEVDAMASSKVPEDEDSEEYKQTFNTEVPSKEYDQYRTEAIKKYDSVYDQERSVLPKYGGYVPGLKFRYGPPFGQLTFNARELGIEANKSRTWGGAVSLF